MSLTAIVTGNDFDLTVECGANLSAATSVKVALVKQDRSGIIAGPWTASSGYVGAAWSAGTVVVGVPAADTAATTADKADVEVQVITGGKVATYTGTRCLPILKALIP